MNNLNKLQNYKHIILDFDGTIAKIVIDWNGWHDFAKKLFKSYDPEIKYSRTSEIHRLQNDLVEKFGSTISKQISDFNREYEYKNIKDLVPNEELITFIKENAYKKKFYIVSNQNQYLLSKLLKDLEIFEFFDKTITRDDVILIKPNPEGMLKIIGNSNDLNEYIFVGDAKVDEDVAKSIGIDFEYVAM